jgi:hypothetical protein
MADDGKSAALTESSYVLVARDYADIAHLENPGVIERILLSSRTEKVAYVSALLTSGLSKYALAGPKVAFAAMAVEALTDFGREVSEWIRIGRLPEDFSGRLSGYQTWVELLQEIDSNPIDADRLKAMKAMFLAANDVKATDQSSVLAYQLFQIAKGLSSSQLLLLRGVRGWHLDYIRGPRTGGSMPTVQWREAMAQRLGHKLSALIIRDEHKLVEYGLIAPSGDAQEINVPLVDARMTDLGIKFCQNLETYQQTQRT